MAERLIPTGVCWCGCHQEARIGKFFIHGHDKMAESGVIKAEYGSVPAFLKAHGYGPGGKSSRAAFDKLRKTQ